MFAMANKLGFTNKKNFIKARLIERGIKLVDIARELGIAPPTVTQVISGIKTSRRIQKTIAQKIGMNVDELWPKNNHRRKK